MKIHDAFWKLEALSDRQLLERLGSVLGSTRQLMAELIAHLGEVEERRLHLAAACSSMFAYCLKLGMTEDEAYRRIEVARLARQYPAIFPLLADGQLTISSVALLKHYLSDDNHVELLAAVSGKTVVQTRELIATGFPRPDVASSVRKLPDVRAGMQPSLAISMPTEPRMGETETRSGGTEARSGGTEAPMGETERRTSGLEPRTGATQPPHSQRAASPSASSRIEPLSAQRYKVQFTASAELARKLELARDLMRHSHPGGELGPIVERALDLLIESLMQRRFGKRKKASPQRISENAAQSSPGQRRAEQRGHLMGDRLAMHRASPAETAATALAEAMARDIKTRDSSRHGNSERDTAEPASSTTLDSADVRVDRRGDLTRAPACSYIPRSTRRAVVERDGLGCAWVDEHGVRCGSQAWLEYDHRRPRAKGGGSEPDNLRLLCRNHNQLAAEQEYGRSHVERTIAERRGQRAPHEPPAT